MKIIIYTPAFLPKIGGLENMANMLAHELCNLKHDVSIITLTENLEVEQKTKFKIMRKPSIIAYWRAYCNCDLILFLNISLKGIWPIFLKKKPVFVNHGITYYNLDGSLDALEKLKLYFTKYVFNIYCSNFVKQSLPKARGMVIHNAYNQEIFKVLNEVAGRKKELIFVGRLVSDKGVDTLLGALFHLKKEGIKPSLSIVGSGPELLNLQKICTKYNLEDQVTFLGKVIGIDLAKKLNMHQILVVPSKWQEPFGLVALEGLACGCKVIISKHGGLKEAADNSAYLFINGDEISLCQAIKKSLTEIHIIDKPIDKNHLRIHEAPYIAELYECCFYENILN